MALSIPDLIAAREAAGLTRTELAAQIHRTEGTVEGYERGRVSPPLDVLDAMAAVLGIAPSTLIADPAPATAGR